MKIKKIADFILDILFPKFCLGCEKEGEWLCDDCFKKIKILKNQSCLFCHRLCENGLFCAACDNNFEIDGILRATTFKKSKLLRKLIHYYKYRSVKELNFELGKVMKREIIKHKKFLASFDLITFVPLHKSRLRERGYNQSALLAAQVSDCLNLENVNLLKRKRNTKPQMELTKEKREKNIAGAFKLNNDFDVKNKKILIIDDVATTLSTLNECARVLKLNGAKRVMGIVVAKDD